MKIGVVGSGFVGATAAYSLVLRGIGRQVVLVDKNEKRSRAEADDIFHAVPFSHPLRIDYGEYSDLAGSRVVIIAAGVSQRPGESRLKLLQRNAAVFREVIPSVLSHASNAVLLIATNPVDVMTHLAARYAAEQGVPSSRVIGSGTTLDTARFRALLGNHLGVDSHHVHAYVIGEHGDSEVLTWSLVTVGGTPLESFCKRQNIDFNETIQQKMDEKVRHAAYTIIEGKGSTYYGIGAALAYIVNVILHDQRAILTLTTPTTSIEGVSKVSVSLPHLVGGKGILATFPLPLSESEKDAIHQSAQVVRQAIDEIDAA